jgi:hypothetical protein
LQPSRRRFCLRLATGAAALAAGFHARSRAAQAGPGKPALQVESFDFEWLDARRERAVPARLYLPAAATASSPVPLVVF